MKIRMNEMTPEGKILNRGEVVIGETALEIVRGMMRDNPYMNDQTETAYMGLTLARIGEADHTLPVDPEAAAGAFLRVLRDRGLTTEVEDDLQAPITNVKVRLVGEDGNAFAILGRCGARYAQSRLSPVLYRHVRCRGHSGQLRRSPGNGDEIRGGGVKFQSAKFAP